jgi:CheY-like chemotaxis protein/anti-sigma regulatory factor (Ser/Thr protein kinase)
VADVVQSAIEEVRASAHAKGIELRQHLTPGCIILADTQRIQQVVSNLLSNALKFTSPGGRVDILVERLERDIRLTVHDDGCGIAPRDLPHIFEHFRQADSSTTRARSGLGLGLAIARHIVQAHAGTIVARSEGLGCGTTLTVHVPAHLGSPSSPPPATDPQLGTESVVGVKVLCVDDQAEALELTALMLAARGAVVRTASSVDEAIAVMYEFVPDVLVSDVAMPGQSGYDLIECVGQLPEPLSTTPAIALTAYARSDDAQHALRRGFSCHVGKPVNADRLAEVIARLAKTGRYPVAD